MKSFTIRLDDDKHKKLKIKAINEGKSLQVIVNALIDKYLEEKK